MANYFVSGDWNVICDVCGCNMKASEAKHRWDGFIVCPNDFEMRHEQDFVKAKTDKIIVPFTRPEPEDVFVSVTYVFGQDAVANVAIAGQAISGRNIYS